MPGASNERKTLHDQAARDAIAGELDSNVMVFAGAGAGKTYALVQRMVATVRTGACEADRMAAITFTRKAAGEMRVRFFQALREAADSSSDPEESARIDAALDRIDQCFMGTIHSFCGRLIRMRPIEAGLAPGFSEVEGREEARLLRDTWDRFVEERYRERDSRLATLRDAGLVPDDLYAFFTARCQYSDLPIKKTDTPKPDFAPPLQAMKEFLGSEAIVRGMPDNPETRDRLMDAALRARSFLKNNKVTSDADAAEALALFESAGRGKSSCVILKHWLHRGLAKSLRDELFPAFWEQAGAALREWREYLYGFASDFVEDAVDYSARRRLEEGKLTFQDLLLRAKDLLRENSSVREHLQTRYRVLFVDEFQDTDPIQAEIIFYLTGQETSERDWRKLTPRPGSLFLVGDDKQSIYRFRRADIAIGRFVRERILATGGRVLQLNTSFRSLGALCRWMNDAFAPIFAEDSAPRQAAFEPLLEHRPDGADAWCVRKISVSPPGRASRRADVAQEDARRIVSFIAQALQGGTSLQGLGDGADALLDAPASPGDFLILARTKGMLAMYMRALEEAGIPYVGEGGDGLGESEEAQTVLMLLETVLNPGNPVPFLAFLRGPLAGFSDDMLYAYREAGGVFHWNADNPEGLPADMARRFGEAKGLVRHAAEDFATLPPAAALQSALAASGYLALAAAHPEGGAAFRAGNLIRLLALAQEWAAEGHPWGAIVEELRSLVQESSKDVAQMSVEFGRSDVVRVMNVHQAKGLEAPVVFLADPLDTSYERPPSQHVFRSGEDAWLSMPIWKQFGRFARRIVAQPVGWEEDEAEEARFAEAEEARLLYVSATRARNLLAVSNYDANKPRGPWLPLQDALAHAPELESPSLPDEEERAAPEDAPRRAELLERARERLRRAKEPSYALRSVTGEREEATPAPQRPRKQGRGVKYGRLVHQLFDEAVRGDLPDNAPARIHRMAEAINRGAEDADLPLTADALTAEDEAMAAHALERFQKTPLWENLQRAREVYTEIPLAVSEKSETEGVCVVRGVIDLAYRDDAGWHIVDYKTDRADTEEQAAAVRKAYQPQLDAYAAYWSRLTGAPVADAQLWLAHGHSL